MPTQYDLVFCVISFSHFAQKRTPLVNLAFLDEPNAPLATLVRIGMAGKRNYRYEDTRYCD